MKPIIMVATYCFSRVAIFYHGVVTSFINFGVKILYHRSATFFLSKLELSYVIMVLLHFISSFEFFYVLYYYGLPHFLDNIGVDRVDMFFINIKNVLSFFSLLKMAILCHVTRITLEFSHVLMTGCYMLL